MNKWEYHVEIIPRLEPDVRARVLNSLGHVGWELVSYSSENTAVFKRLAADAVVSK